MAVVLRHPELLRPIQIRRSSVDLNELPTALAERNIPTLNVNSFSSDPSLFYDQDNVVESSAGAAKEEEFYASYGMFMGRPLRYGKLMFNLNYFVDKLLCFLVFELHPSFFRVLNN